MEVIIIIIILYEKLDSNIACSEALIYWTEIIKHKSPYVCSPGG